MMETFKYNKMPDQESLGRIRMGVRTRRSADRHATFDDRLARRLIYFGILNIVVIRCKGGIKIIGMTRLETLLACLDGVDPG